MMCMSDIYFFLLTIGIQVLQVTLIVWTEVLMWEQGLVTTTDNCDYICACISLGVLLVLSVSMRVFSTSVVFSPWGLSVIAPAKFRPNFSLNLMAPVNAGSSGVSFIRLLFSTFSCFNGLPSYGSHDRPTDRS